MRKTIMFAAIAATLAGISGPAQSATTRADRSIASAEEAVSCRGYRRDYRSFNHCVRVNRARLAGYCSRICR